MKQTELGVELFLMILLVLMLVYVIIMVKLHDDPLASEGNEYVGQIIVGILGFFTGKEVGKRMSGR